MQIIGSAGAANRILENAVIAMPLKYLTYFLRSLEMSLINCKVELKFRWTKHCLLATGVVDDTNADPNNIIFAIKDTKLNVPTVTLSAKDNQKLSKPLSKAFERSIYWKEYETKRENKNTTNQTLQELTDCLFWFILFIYQKVLSRIIMPSSMEITFISTNRFWYKTTWRNKKDNKMTRWRLYCRTFAGLWIHQQSF